MWKLYSKSYILHNRASSISIIAAAFLSTGFLSFLFCLGYNLWAYEMAYGNTSVTPLVLLFLALLLMVSTCLMLIIRNTFQLFMNPRIHQLGILSSIGATPRQIRICLIQEAAILCTLPILLGNILGIGLCYGVMEAINYFAAGVAGRQDAVFSYHGAVFAATVLAASGVVLGSVWSPARKLSKLSPIQAIRNPGGFVLKKRRHAPLLRLFFGIEGEIAGNALKAQKKALRTANFSLVLSFLAFSMMLCLTTLSTISTRHTYFERYQDCWDVMVTVKHTDISAFSLTEEVKAIPGVRDAVVYQKADASCILSEADLSEGFFDHLDTVEAPIVLMDDSSFLNYCVEIGIPPSLDGAILLNRYWDHLHSNFRYKTYIPFVREDISSTDLSGIEVPILGCAPESPVLREEYPNYALVHFLPQSLWESLPEKPGVVPSDLYIRILSQPEPTLESLQDLQNQVEQLLQRNCESENRIQEQLANDRMIAGLQWIFGFFCALLAAIGIASVFSNTLGFLHSRKREFAQYQSIGLTPAQLKKLLSIESLVISGRPVLITLPLTILFVQFAAGASYLDPREFWVEAPIGPVLLFAAAIVLSVRLAYFLGGWNLLHCNLGEILKNDTL